METACSWFYTAGSVQYSRCKGFAGYLVWTGPCYLLQAFETAYNIHWDTISKPIEAFEPNYTKKVATIQAETRKSDAGAWQRGSLGQTR